MSGSLALASLLGHPGPPPRILLLESSHALAGLVRGRIEQELGFEVVQAFTLDEAAEAVGLSETPFFVALASLALPDGEGVEVIEALNALDVPVIAFTGVDDEKTRKAILGAEALDYVLKSGEASLTYLVWLLGRLSRNRFIKVLVVDDAPFMREIIGELLINHCYQVVEAGNGLEALEQLAAHPDIKLVVTDYLMPSMDGIELLARIRERHPREELAVIGISGDESRHLNTDFLKLGASDYIPKPFRNEEFYCRVSQVVETIEYVAAIKEAANRDYLTNLSNRRHFFARASEVLASGITPIAAALLDLDHFKAINDLYGHEAGDVVLKVFADLLRPLEEEGAVVARLGGEEFGLLLPGWERDRVRQRLEQLREETARQVRILGGKAVRFTTSIGIAFGVEEGLDDLLRRADQQLFRAKETGRNRVALELQIGKEA